MISLTENTDLTIVRMDDGKANAMSLAFCEKLTETMRAAEALKRPVVLTGAGRIFSAGVDLPLLVREGEEYVRAFLPALDRAFASVAFASVPVVAAVNGHAIAGGCVLTCACDYRVLVDRGASIGVPELRVGVPFPHLPFEIMRASLPPEHFREVVLLGRNYDPAGALAHGLVDILEPASALLETAEETARQLGSVPAATFRFTKEQLLAPLRARLREAAKTDGEALALWTSPAAAAAITKFIETTIRGKARPSSTEETV
ncbi:MAG: enoyl-CoA hydratase/isomerase family protein [Gemmatimonadetes bacterium]|nr:enoyl-CoA hydratase/isomerase family protein [Gemmatimonadota bacterium]